jgi:hypothetical protein
VIALSFALTAAKIWRILGAVKEACTNRADRTDTNSFSMPGIIAGSLVVWL